MFAPTDAGCWSGHSESRWHLCVRKWRSLTAPEARRTLPSCGFAVTLEVAAAKAAAAPTNPFQLVPDDENAMCLPSSAGYMSMRPLPACCAGAALVRIRASPKTKHIAGFRRSPEQPLRREFRFQRRSGAHTGLTHAFRVRRFA